jgi:putative polyketide hydroxylase
MNSNNIKTQVVIVGGGITGIAAALFLAQQGVEFVLLEKHAGTSIYPRARTIDIRTMELFRSLGLSEMLREGGKDLAPAWGIIRGNNLLEALHNVTADISKKLTPAQLIAAQQEMQELAAKSPETICRCTQDISEAIMCRTAINKGSDLRFHHQVLSFKQHEHGVTVLVKDRKTEGEYNINADYLIAGDGANSQVRNYLNVTTSGNISGKDLLNIYFEADLGDLVKGQEFSQFLIEQPDVTGFLLTINNKDKWAFHLRYHPELGETLMDYPEERIITILHRILGIPDLKIALLKVLPWQLTVRIADDMRIGRIFLAGDAAHTMTPYAGKGANAGIQDVQNLAWKLAAVLNHKAGDALLDTYDIERQPVGAYYATFSGELAQENGLINDSLMITKGKDLLGVPNYSYLSSAIIRKSTKPFTYFIGEPGTRLPHIWLDEAHEQSTIDWIKGCFTLITDDQDRWQSEIDEVKEQTGIAIKLVTVNNQNVRKDWEELTLITNGEALLIRPDDFVAANITSGSLLANIKSILSL